ncbi:hypothetical protein [uncultured Endozoicomonas sp.]|uniref:hypothetical protein n=1 Tax=uncultured Endozoicomonas sp. TaxID=432652 RepID=UPI00260712E1|nr:hypothetical protein [uncultured Endozoicomonas sp.]
MSFLQSWFPALTTTGLFAAALWLARSLISARLTSSVNHEFESKLEVLRSELKLKDDQIASLRTAAMSGLMSRQSILYQRKIEAVDQIWESIAALEKAKHISQTMSILDFEHCAQESLINPKFREFAEQIGGSFEPQIIKYELAKQAQPYLTKLAWAYYSAYSVIITTAVLKLNFLKIGLKEPHRMLNIESTNNLLKSVLPHLSEYIDKTDSSVHHFLLDQIEELLISELRNIQNGEGADLDDAVRASEILKAVEELNRSSSQA